MVIAHCVSPWPYFRLKGLAAALNVVVGMQTLASEKWQCLAYWTAATQSLLPALVDTDNACMEFIKRTPLLFSHPSHTRLLDGSVGHADTRLFSWESKISVTRILPPPRIRESITIHSTPSSPPHYPWLSSQAVKDLSIFLDEVMEHIIGAHYYDFHLILSFCFVLSSVRTNCIKLL